jgi:hypothetical protein
MPVTRRDRETALPDAWWGYVFDIQEDCNGKEAIQA